MFSLFYLILDDESSIATSLAEMNDNDTLASGKEQVPETKAIIVVR